MAKYRITPIGLMWVAISLTSSSGTDNIPRITNLTCFNDFQEKMFCFWEVSSNSNCSKEFTLTYTDFANITKKCLDLGNEQFGGSVLPNKCICNIHIKVFAVVESYKIELYRVESYGEQVANATVYIGSTIKPRAPSNVRVTSHKDDPYGVARWDIGYKQTFIVGSLSFQVQIISKRNEKVIIEETITHRNPEYHFNKRQLERGEDYVFQVRAKPVEKLQGDWGDWSEGAEWRNDYNLTILEQMDIVIPVASIVILFLIIIGYVCLTRYKKKWWDTIPNPANSLIIKRKPIQEHQSVPDRKHAATKSCGRFFSRIVKAHKSKCDQLTRHDTAPHYIIDIVSSDGSTFIFEPQTEDIERWIEILPIREDESNQVQESKPEPKAEDRLLEDLSIANMLFSILHDSSCIKMNTFENLDTKLMDCSVLMAGGDKESNLNISRDQTLECRNYDPDESPVDCSSNIAAVRTPSFNQWLDNELSSCITSQEESYQSNVKPKSGQIILQCHESKSGPSSFCQASGYQSFDQAVQENEPELGCHMSGYESFDQAVLYRDETFVNAMNQYQSFDQTIQEYCPGSGYHLTGYKSFDQTVQESDETFVRELNQYQSFNQAAQEKKPELGCHLSGYKSFDQAVQQGEKTFVNQYQSYDQAVEDYCPKPGCHLSGYKSFDQAIQEGDDTFVHEVNAYQSFDQAVEQGDETFVSEMKPYQSFDQAVQESWPETGCHLSGYKSFDQTVQEGNDASVHEVNIYQRYDHAVQKGETLGSKHCSIRDSGYKPFESLIDQNNYLDKITCMCKNDKNWETNMNFDSRKEYRLLSSDLMELVYRNSAKSTKGNYPSFSGKLFNTLKIARGTNNDMALKHAGIPLALTFDICEHLKNLENMPEYKVPPNNLENGRNLVNEAIFLCHPVLFAQKQLAFNKNVTLKKCPSTTLENMPLLMPLYDLHILHLGQKTKHLLIQQSSYDKDGNSYMKIK